MPISPPKLKTDDSILFKDHTAEPFDPAYVGDYHSVSIKGNQVEVMPASEGKTNKMHLSDVN